MKIEIGSGSIILINGKSIYSRHNPEKEADRYVDTCIDINKTIFLLIAPGMSFLKKAIQRKKKEAQCLSIQPMEFSELLPDEVDSFFGNNSQTLEDYLRIWLDEINIFSVEIVFWPPSFQIFREFCLNVGNQVTSFIRETVASSQTTKYFGRRWIRNIYQNLVHIPKISKFPTSNGLAILAGSGPGLNDCLTVLRNNRKKYLLWALPSSLRALAKVGITADIIVSSDAGYWAAEHLRYLSTSKDNENNQLIIAPCRAMLRPLWNHNFPTALFTMNMPFENDFSMTRFEPAVGEIMPCFPDRGTVAITALDLLKAIHIGPIISIGLDFAWHDLSAHVVPHTFAEQDIVNASRLNSLHHSIYQKRSNSHGIELHDRWFQIEPLNIYESWLAKSNYGSCLNLYDYNPSCTKKNLKEINLQDMEYLISTNTLKAEIKHLGVFKNCPDYKNSIQHIGYQWTDPQKLAAFNTDFLELAAPFLIPKEWHNFKLGKCSQLEMYMAMKFQLKVLFKMGRD